MHGLISEYQSRNFSASPVEEKEQVSLLPETIPPFKALRWLVKHVGGANLHCFPKITRIALQLRNYLEEALTRIGEVRHSIQCKPLPVKPFLMRDESDSLCQNIGWSPMHSETLDPKTQKVNAFNSKVNPFTDTIDREEILKSPSLTFRYCWSRLTTSN